MVFCGGCGKKASDEDKFCTQCGNQLTEITVEVTKETGEVIKEGKIHFRCRDCD